MSLRKRESPWILYIDPDGETRERLRTALAERGIRTEAVADADTARSVLETGRPSCVVTEFDLGANSGFEMLTLARDHHEDIPVVLFTDSGSEQIASEAMTVGVTDYFRKRPLQEQLPALVDRVEALAQPSTQGQISETLKDRAMDRAPVGITIADMRLPDEPLIYVNDAFERMTGYSASETVGRNCRFLQGEDSDEDAIATMRRAIETDDSTAVELRNYTKEGTEFWNRVEIAPIREEDGEATHYVGYQTDVSARKEAEIAARDRADALERKQAKLESLLRRIEGLLREVSVGVIHARTAEEIEQQVCDALVKADGYQFAWMGERMADGDGVSVEIRTTVDDSDTDVEAGGDLVDTALEEDVVAFDGQRPDGTTDAECRWLGTTTESRRAVVPVTYRDTSYGVVGIHTDDEHEFDEHEATVLSTLGRIAGTAVNAVRTQSLLQGEAAIELELTIGQAESFVGLSSSVGCALDHKGTIPPGEDPEVKLFFEVRDGSPSTVVEHAREREDIEDATIVRADENQGGGLVRLSVIESPLIDTLVEKGGTITDATAANGVGTVTIQLTKDADPRTTVNELESRIPGASLQSYRDEQRPQRSNQEFVAEVNSSLTDRQRDALQTAYASGFFDWPRQASGDEVADVMDITRATFHQHLRTAERKLLDAFYET